VLDGYFPGVLKREFPEGVPLQLVDHTRTTLADLTAALASPVRSFLDLGMVDTHMSKVRQQQQQQQQQLVRMQHQG
jgi:hypothetical protein